MISKTSVIRIGRYNDSLSSSSNAESKLQTNRFALLDDVLSEDDNDNDNPELDGGYYLGIPPLDQIDPKKGILGGKSWADEVGA